MPYEGPKIYRRDELTYNRYQGRGVAALQQLQSDPPHHDELLFITIHQAYESWFKQIIHEMESCIQAMRPNKVLPAYRRLTRIHKILQLLVSQIHILETMAPIDFLQFREKLNPASGFQSIQFREVEFLAGMGNEKLMGIFQNWPEYQEALQRRLEGPTLRSAYYEVMRAYKYRIPEGDEDDPEIRAKILDALRELYQHPNHKLPIYFLSEALIEFDEDLVLWRQHHVLARLPRHRRPPSRHGWLAGVKYLESTTVKRAFPLLWEARGLLTKEPQWEGEDL